MSNQAILVLANSLIRINSKSNLVQQFYEPGNVLEITDYFNLDVYKGFLIRHEAKFSENITLEVETWCRPNNQHAQVSKSNKIAKKIMQLDVSTDFDQKVNVKICIFQGIIIVFFLKKNLSRNKCREIFQELSLKIRSLV